MKMRHSTATGFALIGLLYSHASSAQAPPTPAKPQAPTAAEAPAQEVSPEEIQRRKDWNKSMMRRPVPKKGCFTAAYPTTEWQAVPCAPAPLFPQPPRHGPPPSVVGGGNDVSAQAPSGFISQAIGTFENITNVTSESGPIANSGPSVANAYSLQINTNYFTSTACAGSPNPGCQGWQQFVYSNDGSSGGAYIQYWLYKYNTTCPAGQNWTQFSFTGDTDIYCWRNNSAGVVVVPNQPITNLGNLTFSGRVSSTGDSVSLSTGTNVYAATGDNAVNAAQGWNIAEFNIVGDGGNNLGGGQASFNAGASINTRTEIIYGGTSAPMCAAVGFTAETNNLSFGPTAPPATPPGPAIIFQESIAGGAMSACAAAATVGDSHLITFKGLLYDFQASGDFILAQVDRSFTVQTRQASGAPQWPNASVNKAVAARMGKTQVAVCLAPPETGEPARVHVDGKLTTVDDGKALSLPDGVYIRRQGNVYLIRSDAGDSVRAEVNPTWINVNVGLGRWPAAVHGLIANANEDINQIATRDNFVLTNPFPFDELYHRYADSWRVAGDKSMLSVCGDGEIERGIPERPFFAKDLPPDVRERTRGVCLAAGVKAGPLLEACTLDVAVIGQDAAANVFVGMNSPQAVGDVTGGGGGGLPGHWWWLVLLLAIILIVWLLIRRK
ncbi:VWD domain-containing protein [Sorangium sp. So ce1000]|uniref:VWD domain-containing protein n=1 Tax=Sorangium sp. So ce1000 TaxID=3133325 RepID=UPI003F5F3800